MADHKNLIDVLMEGQNCSIVTCKKDDWFYVFALSHLIFQLQWKPFWEIWSDDGHLWKVFMHVNLK